MIDNQRYRHLQIDSNTKIFNFRIFYNKTFGASDSEQRTALNACYYDSHYISVHNKVVYTTAGSQLVLKLEEQYLSYVELNKDADADKGLKRNSIYARVFTGTLEIFGLTRQTVYVRERDDSWTYYPDM